MQKSAKVLSFFKKNKKYVYSALAATAGVGFCSAIYFSQTMYFYKMQNVQLQSGNSVESFNGSSEYIAKKYKRTPAKTLTDPLLPANTDPIDYYPNFFKAQTNTSIQDQIFDSTNPKTPGSFMSDDYINNAIATNTLMQHPAAKYMYDTYVTDDVLAVSKVFNFDLQTKGWLTTGLFIPPGEIVELKFPGMTDDQVKALGLKIQIGSSEGVNATKSYYKRYDKRMPNIVKDVVIDSANFRYGTPFGGMISIINPKTIEQNLVMQIDNAVETLHYVHGETSESEWKRLLKEAKAPVFEFRTDTIQFFGQNYWLTSKRTIDMNDLEYPYKVMELYRKLGADSLNAVNKRNTSQEPVKMYYSYYISNASGAEAVSIPLKFVVTAADYWASGLLNYDNFFHNGSWGNVHEFNHQWQLDRPLNGVWAYWGFASYIEVSNNTLNAMSYIDFLNIQSDRTTPDKISKGHAWKTNGYTIAQTLNNQKNKSTGANEAAYMVVPTLLGTDAYKDTIRSVYDNSIVVPNAMYNNDLNGTFVYRISKATGYNWSDFYEPLGLLDKSLLPGKEGTETKPYGEGVTPYQQLNKYPEISSLPKIHPAYSFYAAETSYGNDKNFNPVARPFKVSGSEPTTLKIQEYTNTNDKVYDLSNIQLVSQPKYGTIKETNNNGKIEYIYTPNKKHKNDLDEFVYKVTSTQRSDTNKATNSDDIYFKVQLFQDDGNYVWQSPDSRNVDIKPVAKSEDISKNIIDVSNVKVYKVKNNEDILDEKSTALASKLFDNNYSSNQWESSGESGNMKFVIPFNKKININSLKITFRRFTNGYENPTNVELYYKDKKNNLVKALDSKIIWGSVTQTHKFDEIETKEIILNFKALDDKGAIINSRLFNFAEFDFGKSVSPTNIIVPDSSLLRLRGDWREGFGVGKVNFKSLFTILTGSQLEFTFEGDSFYINGVTDKNYGSFSVYVDGKKIDTISSSSQERFNNKTIYLSNQYDYGKHNVRIVSSSTKPLEFNYFAVNGTPLNVDAPDLYYLYTVGIPLILVTVLAAIIVPTVIVLKKRKKYL